MQPLKGTHNPRIFPDTDALNRHAARHIQALAAEAIARRDEFHIALAGGSTPERLYRLLASAAYRSTIDWRKVHVWFGDERCVPPDHPDSNYRMAREALLAHAPISGERIHRMAGELDPALAVARYADTIETHLPRAHNDAPIFDLILLGLGPDGHTASLFPQTEAPSVTDRPVAAAYVPKFNTWRITLTLPVLDNARHLMFLVAGAGKASIIDVIFNSAGGHERLPVEMITAVGEVTWWLDASAAAEINKDSPPRITNPGNS